VRPNEHSVWRTQRYFVFAMKRLSTYRANRAMTLIEVLVVILMVTIVAFMILPAGHHPTRAPIVRCLNNLKQIDLGFIMYASENNGKFPIQTPVTNGGTMDFLARNQTFPHYQKISGYIRDMSLLICPTDKNRRAAANYENLTDTNLSYFLNADVSTNNATASIMVGDRNIEANGKSVGHGTFTFATNMNVAWTRELHPNIGALGFADGHAGFSHGTDLNSAIQSQGLAGIRFSVP
jgi:hypothetical protein